MLPSLILLAFLPGIAPAAAPAINPYIPAPGIATVRVTLENGKGESSQHLIKDGNYLRLDKDGKPWLLTTASEEITTDCSGGRLESDPAPAALFDTFYGGLTAAQQAQVEANLRRIGPNIDWSPSDEPRRLPDEVIAGKTAECYDYYMHYSHQEPQWQQKQCFWKRIRLSNEQDSAYWQETATHVETDVPLDGAMFTPPACEATITIESRRPAIIGRYALVFTRLLKPDFTLADMAYNNLQTQDPALLSKITAELSK